jgi:gas vesicle protein
MPELEEQQNQPDPEAVGGVFPGTSFVAGVVVGAFVGACIALLVAPARGRIVRRRLGRRARELAERAGEGLREEVDDASDRARRDFIRRRRRFQARLDRLAADAGEAYADPM